MPAPGPGQGEGRRTDETGSEYIGRRSGELQDWVQDRAAERARGISPKWVDDTHEPHDPVRAAKVREFYDKQHDDVLAAERARREAEQAPAVADRQQRAHQKAAQARLVLGIASDVEGAQRQLAAHQADESRQRAEPFGPVRGRVSYGPGEISPEESSRIAAEQNKAGEESQEDPPGTGV